METFSKDAFEFRETSNKGAGVRSWVGWGNLIAQETCLVLREEDNLW